MICARMLDAFSFAHHLNKNSHGASEFYLDKSHQQAGINLGNLGVGHITTKGCTYNEIAIKLRNLS